MRALAALAVAISLGAVGAACAPRLPPPVTAADADRAGVPLASLQEGRKLLVRKCGSCHRAPLPTDHAAGDWPVKLDEMSARANLAPAQRRAIEQYLVAMAEAPRAAAPAPSR